MAGKFCPGQDMTLGFENNGNDLAIPQEQNCSLAPKPSIKTLPLLWDDALALRAEMGDPAGLNSDVEQGRQMAHDHGLAGMITLQETERLLAVKSE